ncbi:MAG: sugar ABC transporter permease [Chloroflexi bacterium]|nr:sugar ABC transporter permease [Chloroflexota bacterium]
MVGKTKRWKLGLAQREELWGFAFVGLWIIGFFLWTAIPMTASLVFSFTNLNPIHPDQTRFVGLANYMLLFNDLQVRDATWITLRFALISVPLSIVVPLAIAVLVNSKYLIGKNIFRTLFYMPYLIPVVVGVMVWQGILNSESGWLNRIIEAIFGIKGPRWFQDEFWVLPALTIMGFWGIGNTMLTLLAGLQNVPTEMYEAAEVDGAGPVYTFFRITLPMISPVIFYNLTIALICAFQYFTQAYIIGNGRGDPNGQTTFYNIYLYKTAFAFQDMGYGSTLAWAMFIVVLILTVILFKTQSRWVYYGGGED